MESNISGKGNGSARIQLAGSLSQKSFQAIILFKRWMKSLPYLFIISARNITRENR